GLFPKPRPAVAILVLSAALAAGQTPSGSIAGRATDESGRPLPGVTIEVTGPGMHSARVGLTDSSGSYRMDGLAPGVYSVSFRLLDFVGVIRKNIALGEGGAAKAD